MRRLSLRAVAAVTVSAFFASPAALAQYAADYGRGGAEDPPAAIALFSDENYYGDVRDVYDPFSTLRDLSYNDRARSVAVFGGQWELCEDKDFTGRCVFIREDVSDLGWFGLAGRVTSVRPVYEYTEAQHGLMFTRDKYGYIRYADNEVYGYDTWNHGYASSWGISVSHYGYSPDYYRYGYYSPTWGYDPYGFAWGPRGSFRYTTTTYRRLPRPSVINPYWSGWDYRRTDWRRGNWSWHGTGDWRDHRDRRGGDGRDGRGGHGGGDWRPGDTGGGHGGRDDRPPSRDVPGDRWGPGAGGSGSVVPSDPRTGRGGGDGRRGSDTVASPVPIDPRAGQGGGGGRDGRDRRGGGGFSPGAGSGTAVVTAPADPRSGRGSRGGDAVGLAGGPSPDVSAPRGGADGWRGGGRGGEGDRRGGRSGDGVSSRDGGRRSAPAVVASPPPPPPAADPPQSRREPKSDKPRDSGKGGFRRRNGDD